jgi:hypothetical protein
VLKRLAHLKQKTVAAAMGVSEPTVTRIKDERLEEVLLLLAHLGIKCVPQEYRCVAPQVADFNKYLRQTVLERAPELLDGEE